MFLLGYVLGVATLAVPFGYWYGKGFVAKFKEFYYGKAG